MDLEIVHAKSNLPASDVPNYIEIWIIMCIMFILGAFTQTILVILVIRSKDLEIIENVSQVMVAPVKEMLETKEDKLKGQSKNSRKQIVSLEKVDLISFIIFTILFILFNMGFWLSSDPNKNVI